MIYGLYYYHNLQVVSLPLLNVRAEASIKELAAQVKLTQTYGNDAAFPIEAKYSFPIPARAAVCSFVMIKQDGTRIVGLVQEKQEARETYDAAVSQGQQASLMEQQTPDVFQVSVGNIPSNEQVQIELVYATELSEDEENDSIRFHLPVHIGARYGQAPQSTTSSFRNTVFFSSASKTPFLNIAMSVEAVAPISKIGCPSHTVSTELGPDPSLPNFKELPFSNYARVSLSSDSALDKDFVLTIKSTGLDAPRCVAEPYPSPSHDTVAMALTLVPRFKLPDLARQEFVFLVDRSGSMQHQRIAAARKALVVMLRALPHKDSLFQIISFGSQCSALWAGGSRPYNQATLEEATAHVDGMQANFGGTEIRHALAECFTTCKLDRPTSVFVLTDGDAWDLTQVLEEVKGAVARAPAKAYLRVSVLGIGNSASTAMCEGIARVGNGTCMMVGEQETTFTGKIARLLKAARTPAISDIRVDWGRPSAAVIAKPKVPETETDDEFEMVDDVAEKLKKKLNIFDEDAKDDLNTPPPPPPPVVLPPPAAVQQAPFKIRNLFPSIRLNVYAILQGKTIPKTVTLRGSTADGDEIELPIPVTISHLPNEPAAPPAIHALAARKIIQDLEDGQHALVQTLSNPDDTDLLARTVKASIVRLGKTYSVSSTHTSFVAVDEARPDAAPPAYWVAQPVSQHVVLHSMAPHAMAPPSVHAFYSLPPQPHVALGMHMMSSASNTSYASAPGGSPSYGGGWNAPVGSAPPTIAAYAPPTIAAYAPPPRQQQSTQFLFGAAPAAALSDLDGDQFSGLSPSMSFGGATDPVTSGGAAAPIMFGGATAAMTNDRYMQSQLERKKERKMATGNKPHRPQMTATDIADPLEALARLQSFDGCFSLDVINVIKLNTTLEHVRGAFPAGATDAVVATVIGLAFLSTKLGATVDRDSWEGMYEKAQQYVEAALRDLGSTETVDVLETKIAKMLA